MTNGSETLDLRDVSRTPQLACCLRAHLLFLLLLLFKNSL